MSARVIHVGLSEADYQALTALARRCGRKRVNVAALAVAVFVRHPHLEGDEFIETLAKLAAPPPRRVPAD